MANDISTQTVIQREAPEVEAYKLGLLQEARRLYNEPMMLPAVEAAGLSPAEQQAMDLARQGIGAFEPYVQAGAQGLTQGMDLTQRGALTAGAIQTAPAFQKAQDVMGYGVNTLAPMGEYQRLAGAGLQDIGAGIGRVIRAGDIAGGFMQADLRPAQGSIGAAQLAATAATPSDFTTAARILGGGMQGAAGATQTAQQAAQVAGQQYGGATGVLGAGIGSLMGAAQAYDPNAALAYMNPYQQGVTQQALGEMRRQADIARQGQAAQAVAAGAFGGTREGVQRAEFERGIQDLMTQRIMQDYAQNYLQAQQAAMQGFEAQQQRQLGQAQGLQSAAGLGGQLAGQQAQLGLQVAAQQFQQAGYDANTAMQLAQLQQTQQQQALQQSSALQGIGSLRGQLAGQQAQVGMQLAAQRFQQAGYDANTAMQLAQLQQTQQQQALQQSSALLGIGGLQGQLGMQQAQLGQAGAGLVGQLGAQQAQLGQLPSQIAQSQAGIAAQQAGLYGTLGQGIGALTAQQAATDLQKASTLGSLGGQMGQLGSQYAGLGEATQRLGAADVGLLAGLGGIERGVAQSQLDAMRQTQVQEAMTPYQQLGFISDIYRGAPTTSMALTSQTAPSASPMQTALGYGVAGLSAAAGLKGLF